MDAEAQILTGLESCQTARVAKAVMSLSRNTGVVVSLLFQSMSCVSGVWCKCEMSSAAVVPVPAPEPEPGLDPQLT